MRSLLAATILGVSLTFAAAQAAEMTPKDKAVFEQLTPDLQKQVKARLNDGNTVRGVLETMLLNEISLIEATNRIQAVDFDEGVAIVELPDGDVDTFYFDTTTLVLKSE